MKLKEFTTLAVTNILEGLQDAKASGYQATPCKSDKEWSGINFDLVVQIQDDVIHVADKGFCPDDRVPTRIAFRAVFITQRS